MNQIENVPGVLKHILTQKMSEIGGKFFKKKFERKSENPSWPPQT